MNAAIVGTGLIAGYHAKALKEQGNPVAVKVVVGSGMQKAQQFAERWGIPRAGADFSMALADDIDVVHICTPPALHHQMVRDALKAGKHVVCEKPFTLTRPSPELVELARSSNLVNAVCFNIRFHPACQEARSIIAGDIGRLYFVHGSYLQEFHLLPCPLGWRYDAKCPGPCGPLPRSAPLAGSGRIFHRRPGGRGSAQFGISPRRWRVETS